MSSWENGINFNENDRIDHVKRMIYIKILYKNPINYKQLIKSNKKYHRFNKSLIGMNHKGEGNNEESKKIDENCLNQIEIFFWWLNTKMTKKREYNRVQITDYSSRHSLIARSSLCNN